MEPLTATGAESSKPLVAVVGTTHPWNAAGLGLTLMVLHELGAIPLAIVAGVTAQAPGQAAHRFSIPAVTIEAQFEALRAAPIGAYAIGAMLGAESVEAVAAGIASRPEIPAVCDPVLRSSDGAVLADPPATAALVKHLFPFCALVTPNLPEAEAFLGRPIPSIDAMPEAALAFCERSGARAVLLKGGHLEGDVRVWGEGDVGRFASERLDGELRGTGDLLAAGIAFALASGATLPAAVEAGRAVVRERWIRATTVGGMRIAL